MGKFAPVAPIQILEGMKEANCFGDYHLLLTHHVLENDDRFRELFDNLPMCTIVMDNSVVELGDAVSNEKVHEACEIIRCANPSHPNYDCHWIYPVLIDVMSNGPATIEASDKSWDWWKANAPSYRPMAVLQGSDWKSFTQTADHFLTNPKYEGLANVGIPRVLVDHLGTRQLAIQYVDAIRPDINVHLLGFSNDVTDDVICANMPQVAGIDSAVPIRYGYSGGTGLYTPSCAIPARPKDWFEKGTYTPDIYQNVQAMRRWVA